jgi:hypothetical protein
MGNLYTDLIDVVHMQAHFMRELNLLADIERL